jgi:hypothetical protein
VRLKEKKKSDAQGSLLNFGRRQGTISKAKEELDKALLQHIVSFNSPFSEVEEESFRHLMLKACPDYIVPCERTIARRVDEKYAKVKLDLKKELIGKTYHKTVAVTFVHGTSSDRFHTKELGISLHYVNSEMELKAETLGEVKSVGSQTGPIIWETVKTLPAWITLSTWSSRTPYLPPGCTS